MESEKPFIKLEFNASVSRLLDGVRKIKLEVAKWRVVQGNMTL